MFSSKHDYFWPGTAHCTKYWPSTDPFKESVQGSIILSLSLPSYQEVGLWRHVEARLGLHAGNWTSLRKRETEHLKEGGEEQEQLHLSKRLSKAVAWSYKIDFINVYF